jgi:UDP-glucose 4-epimerase
MILGFDPRYQFVHEDDVVHGLEHVVQRELPGVFNLAADGVLTLTEVAGLLGKPYAPILPPWGTGLAAGLARRLGVKIPPEMLNQLRFGRGVDNRRLKARGFEYGHTSREAVIELGEHLRLHPLLRSNAEPYRYEREVEEFLRWSPNVRSSRLKRDGGLSREQMADLQRLLSAYEPPDGGREGRPSARAEPIPAQGNADSKRAPATAAEPPPPALPPVDHYDDLGAEEVISLLGSLDGEDLVALRDHERQYLGRDAVLGAIDSVLARQAAARG